MIDNPTPIEFISDFLMDKWGLREPRPDLDALIRQDPIVLTPEQLYEIVQTVRISSKQR